MLSSLSVAASLALFFAPYVRAHGYVATIEAGGQTYPGSNPNWFYTPKAQIVPTAGWFALNQDNGFVAPDAYGTTNITCHKSATPGNREITVAAGTNVTLQWNTWPVSHHGPILDYLANCNGSCTTVDVTKLNFVKIDQGALLNDATPPGTWVTDELIANNFTWNVVIPKDINPGNYVLRTEIIALHSAEQTDGAQNYPQCINLNITGQGTIDPCASGADCSLVPAMYKENDPGVLVDIYEPLPNYTIPGPTVWTG